MSRPLCLLIRRHLHRRFRWTEAVKSVSSTKVSSPPAPPSLQVCMHPHLCQSPALPLTPFHINTAMPTSATTSKKRVRVKKFHIALLGGNRARALFQFMPEPFESSMVGMRTGPESQAATAATPERRALLRGSSRCAASADGGRR